MYVAFLLLTTWCNEGMGNVPEHNQSRLIENIAFSVDKRRTERIWIPRFIKSMMRLEIFGNQIPLKD